MGREGLGNPSILLWRLSRTLCGPSRQPWREKATGVMQFMSCGAVGSAPLGGLRRLGNFRVAIAVLIAIGHLRSIEIGS